MSDETIPELRFSARRLLIVERKLIQNRGHHHTQIAALHALLPDYRYDLVAGDAYDGFLGEAVAKLPSDAASLSGLIMRARYGAGLRRIVARLKLQVREKSFRLPQSPFLGALREACEKLKLGANDLIVVPTAELDALEASVDLIGQMKERAPLICLRFLGQGLGEANREIRSRRLVALKYAIPRKLHLFTETDELASYLETQLAAPVIGQFYMPCSMELDARALSDTTPDPTAFRVGIFGPARPEKGSARLPTIIRSTSAEIAAGGRRIDFVVQGSDADFDINGVYRSISSVGSASGNVVVEKHDDRLSPARWADLFGSVDAVLLPYDADVYGLQGSGVVQDAVVARKLILHTRGMSMKELMQHGNAIAATTDNEFARAIVAASQLSGSEVDSNTKKALAYYRSRMLDHPLTRILPDMEPTTVNV